MLVDLVMVRFMVGEEKFMTRTKAIDRAKETRKSVEIVKPFLYEASKVADHIKKEHS